MQIRESQNLFRQKAEFVVSAMKTPGLPEPLPDFLTAVMASTSCCVIFLLFGPKNLPPWGPGHQQFLGSRGRRLAVPVEGHLLLVLVWRKPQGRALPGLLSPCVPLLRSPSGWGAGWTQRPLPGGSGVEMDGSPAGKCSFQPTASSSPYPCVSPCKSMLLNEQGLRVFITYFTPNNSSSKEELWIVFFKRLLRKCQFLSEWK